MSAFSLPKSKTQAHDQIIWRLTQRTNSKNFTKLVDAFAGTPRFHKYFGERITTKATNQIDNANTEPFARLTFFLRVVDHSETLKNSYYADDTVCRLKSRRYNTRWLHFS